MEDEISAALETTIRHLDDAGITLCCGLLGRLEFLKEASKSKSNLQPSIDRVLKNIFAQLTEKSDGIYRPGFMQGQAGIGYTLLRLLDHNGSLPQILLLD